MTQRYPNQNGIGNPSPNGIGSTSGVGETRKSKSPEEIEAEINQTRSAISEDINALGEKLSPEKLREGARGVMHDAKQEAHDFVREAKEAAVGSLRDVKDSAVESLLTAKDSAVETVAETMHEIGDVATRAGSATARFVSANAIPLSLIGLGATWLALSMRRQRSVERDYLYAREYGYDYEVGGYSGASYDERYDEPTSSTHLGEIGYAAGSRGRTGRARSAVGSAKQRVGDATHRAANKLGDVRDQARRGIGNMADRVAETGSHLSTQVRDRAADLGHRASDLSHEARERLRRAELDARDFAQANPLAVGAAAIAAGVGVGLLLPATRRENELLGPTRTRLMDQGKHLISDAKESAERVGRSAKSAVQEVKSSISEST